MSIKCLDLTHTYQIKSPLEQEALKNINLTLEDGKYIAIVGHTGSGKSTLVEHFNGLLFPTSGEVHIDDYISNNKKRKNKNKNDQNRQRTQNSAVILHYTPSILFLKQ